MEGINIKELRKEIGLSVAEAALQVHITPRSWSRYESGERKIPKGVVELFYIKNNIDYSGDKL